MPVSLICILDKGLNRRHLTPFRVAKAVSTFLTHNTFNQSILIIYQPPLCDISFYSIEYTSLKFPVILAPAISMGPEILKREPEGD